ncbi:PLP-dependent aminotransferase family protein [Rhodospira trueperi]|uniref:DNA-binding transcriptional regulator, MocR family, contains an aminotransferase domain n=1 Tax=Rhodospira trueperi TaxID=69960 RepID=A0A1G6WZU2_9PROT|nr:PLP-dependent aminotransferase family protein [Rhodospira trueperi]SDD71314.1 DNA-binding transcriptional regulator, MocR family, contains an aminotransferase domain [Rhodospira trueperi]
MAEAEWRPRALDPGAPVYRAIADALEEDLSAGRLAPGTRLPTHRALAESLGVTVTTVTRAYAEAGRRGLTSGTVGRGTFVRAPGIGAFGSALELRIPAPPSEAPVRADRPAAVDMGPNLPVEVGADILLAATLRDLADAPADLGPLLAYQADIGMPRHREAGARWVGLVGYAVDPGSIVVTAGVQHALTVALMTLARPGDSVLCGTLTFPGLKLVAERQGLKLVGVPLDDDGLIPEALEDAAKRSGALVLFGVPTMQNPLAVTSSPARREALAEIIARRRMWLIEDDIYGLIPGERPPPIATMIPDRTVFLSGTSKVLAPGLRTGFAVVPEPLRGRFGASVRSSLWMAPPLMVEMTARWILNGQAGRLIQAQRQAVSVRRTLAEEALRDLPWTSGPGSFHLWLPVSAPWRAEGFRDALAARGVLVLAASTFHVGPEAVPEGVRLCLGAESDPARLRRALDIVREVLEAGPEAHLTMP